MTDSDPTQKLAVDEILPVAWERREELLTPEQAFRIGQEAINLIQAALAWGEVGHVPEHAEESSTGRAQELVRIESKLNLLLDVVGELAARARPLPQAVPVSLSSAGIGWQSANPPRAGEAILVHVYVQPGLPRPLTLPATVSMLEEDSGTPVVRAVFTDLSPPVREVLDKLIFRQHRRHVAAARRGPEGPGAGR